MKLEPVFLSLDEILYIHQEEIRISGGEPNIREPNGVEACAEAPKASFGGDFLYDLFEMAAAYITCLTMRHPFVDGNKRTALASALTFLYLNGYSIEETYDEQLADLVVDYVTKKVDQKELANTLKNLSGKIT